MALTYNKVNYTDLTAEQATFYVRTLLSRLVPSYVHRQFGQRTTVPLGEGHAVEWRRFNALSLGGWTVAGVAGGAVVALTEGTPPTEHSFTITQVFASLQQYGSYLAGTDRVLAVAKDQDKVLTQAAIMLGDHMAGVLDLLTREAMVAGTSVQYAGVAGSRHQLGGASTGSYISAAEIREAVKTLKRADAKPINGRWICIMHPDTWNDLMADTSIVNAIQYTQGQGLFTGQIPDWMGVRFVETSLAKVWTSVGGTGADVYATLVFGQDAYGVVDLTGGNVDYIYHPPGSGGTSDPLNQRWTAGWKAMFAASILQNSAIVRIEHTTSQNP